MPIEVMSVRDMFADESTRTIKALVAGPAGAGKTLSASTWPKPLYLDIEGRLLSIRDRDVRRVRIAAVHDMEEAKAILDQPVDVRTQMLGGPVETVVIDTVDELARLVIKERMRSEKVETMRMQDWGFLADTLRNLLRGFRNLDDLNVVFNCHLKSTEDSETGRIEKKPDIQGAVGNEIASYVDEAFVLIARPYTDPSTGERAIKRHLQTYPDSQHDWVKDHSGTLPMEFPVDFHTDYERLAKFIFGDAVGAPPKGELSKEKILEPLPAVKKAAAKKAAPKVEKPKAETAPMRPEIVPEPEPEVVPSPTPVPEPVPQEETEPAAPEPEPEPEGYVCATCGETIDNVDVAEVAKIRYGEYLCRADFAARRNQKSHSVA